MLANMSLTIKPETCLCVIERSVELRVRQVKVVIFFRRLWRINTEIGGIQTVESYVKEALLIFW